MKLSLSLSLSLLVLAACGHPKVDAPSASAAPPASLTYLGVAGWKLDAGGHVLLFDPYFTRLDVSSSDGPIEPDLSLITRYAPARAEGIVVSHSHYDHLLDVPEIAKRTGATILGTESTANVARAAGIAPAQIRAVRAGDVARVGAFEVRAVEALHNPLGLPNEPIPRDIALPMPADGYAEGGTLQYLVTFEGRSVYFIGTGNYVEKAIAGIRPDVAIVAFPSAEKLPEYPCRVMELLGHPRLVFANHFDAHRKPLGPTQMDIGDDGRAHLDAVAAAIRRCSPETKFVVPTHFSAIAL